MAKPARAPEPASPFLTPEQLSERWQGEISPGTLRNWRAAGKGPAFVRLGPRVVYPVIEVQKYEREQLERR